LGSDDHLAVGGDFDMAMILGHVQIMQADIGVSTVVPDANDTGRWQSKLLTPVAAVHDIEAQRHRPTPRE
jgi:hypothetical protein